VARRRTASFTIGKRKVGAAGSVYVIAEAGSNHDGDLEQAKRLIDVAKGAGADAVKFQLFHADRLYPKAAGQVSYLPGKSIYDVIRSLELPREWLPDLKRHAERQGLDFLCTPFDEEGVRVLEELDVPAYKVASYCLTHLPLLRRVAQTRKPVILSTGLGSMTDIREALSTLKRHGNPPTALMHCIASYPAPIDQMNLRVIPTFHKSFGVPVGLSDHTLDPIVAPGAAVALGATLVEKHYTLSRRLKGPDHSYALEPDELARLVAHVRSVASAMGTGQRTIQPCERELYHFARVWIYTVRPVHKGERFTPENIQVLRSGKLAEGLHPRYYERLVGKRAKRDLPVNAPLARRDL